MAGTMKKIKMTEKEKAVEFRQLVKQLQMACDEYIRGAGTEKFMILIAQITIEKMMLCSEKTVNEVMLEIT